MPRAQEVYIPASRGLVLVVPRHRLPEGAAAAAENLTVFEGALTARPGLRQTGGTLNGPVIGLYSWSRPQGGALLAATPTTVYELRGSTWTPIITGLTAASGVRYTWAPWRDELLIVTNGVDPPYKISGNPGNLAGALLGGNPPRARMVSVYQGHVVFGNLTNDAGVARPTSIRWSDLGAPEVWSGGEAGTMTFDDARSPLRAFGRVADFLGVASEDSIWFVNYAVDPFVMTRTRFAVGIGCVGPLAAIEWQDGLYLFSAVNQSIMRIHPSGTTTISKAVETRMFRSISDVGLLPLISGAPYTDRLALAWLIPETATTARLWLAARGSEEAEWTTFGAFTNTTIVADGERFIGLTWDDLTTTWDGLQTTWDGLRGGSGAPILYIGTSDGKVFAFDPGTALETTQRATWESGLFAFGNTTIWKRIVRVEADVVGVSATNIRTWIGTATVPDEAAITWQGPYSGQLIDIDVTTVWAAFRVDFPGGGKLRGIRVWLYPRSPLPRR